MLKKMDWIHGITIGFALMLLAIIYMANTKTEFALFDLVRKLPLGDKMMHFLLIGTITLLVNLSLRLRIVKMFGIKILLGTVVIFCLTTLEECSQMFLPNRSFDLLDMSANILGIIVFSLFALLFKPMLKAK